MGKPKSRTKPIADLAMDTLINPRNKSFSSKEINSIRAITETQKLAFRAWSEDFNLVLHGSAGTGKTFLAMYFALNEVLNLKGSDYDRVIILRSALPTRNIGFLPGTEEEKSAVYEAPYREIVSELFGAPTAYDHLKRSGKIQFQVTSFVRGMNFRNAIVIVEEFQNLNFQELDSCITRIGETSRIIFAGDTAQSDLLYNRVDVSGARAFMGITDRMVDEFRHVEFTNNDVVRSGLVKAYLKAKEDSVHESST